jgi:ABC-type bacteriocin/lantibiotic exporter with double-glycine peptidase domain
MAFGFTSARLIDPEAAHPESNHQSIFERTASDIEAPKVAAGVRSPTPYRSLRALMNAHGDIRAALIGIGVFSCLANLLALTGPIFMLQIYDRVLPARSLPTLTAFLLLAIGL